MPTPTERLYELAQAALDDQKQAVDGIFARLPALLAAAAVVATLLSKPAFDGRHPHGLPELIATTLGLLGAGALVVIAVALFWPRDSKVTFDVNALWPAIAPYADDNDYVHLLLAREIRKLQAANDPQVQLIKALYAGALAAFGLQVVGLGTAVVLAS